MRISGIELKNFRGIGSKPVVLRPWLKCNILVGQNNSGKSTIIKALQKIAEIHSGSGKAKLDQLDLHNRDASNANELVALIKLWNDF